MNNYHAIERWIHTQLHGIKPKSHDLLKKTHLSILGPRFAELSEGQPIQASGNRNDCLIHSFLSCTSSTFRRIPIHTRNEIASRFRRSILTTLPRFNNLPEDDILNGDGVLSEDVGDQLAKQYNICIIFVQSENPLPYGTIKNKRASHAIVIHGNNAHFTPVWFPSNKDDNYIIDTRMGISAINHVKRYMAQDIVRPNPIYNKLKRLVTTRKYKKAKQHTKRNNTNQVKKNMIYARELKHKFNQEDTNAVYAKHIQHDNNMDYAKQLQQEYNDEALAYRIQRGSV